MKYKIVELEKIDIFTAPNEATIKEFGTYKAAAEELKKIEKQNKYDFLTYEIRKIEKKK